jgi:PadR family transcriptional regulator AphA
VNPRLSTTEYAVLGVLAEEPRHGFALAKELEPDGEVGRVFTIHRPLVYRALDRLVDLVYAAPVATEKGDAGPQRVIHSVTPAGRKRLKVWLAEPVAHVRDLRLQFLLKVILLTRSDRSPVDLIRKQREALASTFDALDDPTTPRDPVELWRHHTASAASAYLDELERTFSE